ncbi:hypothetical protein JZ751_029134 [Albula glossodonta]|uniref:ES1 protein n=1 Tax=Albula glossodonta TaxID=121402 RepID=A0A8T2PIX3_9TELE|nr:hypothetical protein JZ751_029134 [Albula glossodonta]
MFAVKSFATKSYFSLLKKHARGVSYLQSVCQAPRVAVVLSGCGTCDGTEIHEASAVLVHLSRDGAMVQLYAPNIPQMHVVDHSNGDINENEQRNVLSESARFASGHIADLGHLRASKFDAIIFPGGNGAIKNLSTFAVDSRYCTLNEDVERVLKEFHKAGKPIGLCCVSSSLSSFIIRLCCMASILAARVLPEVEVTLGHEEDEDGKWPNTDFVKDIRAMGAKHCVKDVHVDHKNKVVSSPAFMCNAELHLVFDGIGAMVKHVLKLTGK